MVALNGLNTASTLLRQIVSGTTGAAAQRQTATPSIAQTASGASTATGSAAKSVSSAIFNAVAASSEKQDKAIKAVLDFIDREYTNWDKKFANYVKEFGHEAETQDAISKYKAMGERLKEKILSDPSTIYKMLDMIKTGRPDISNEHAISLLIADIGKGLYDPSLVKG